MTWVTEPSPGGAEALERVGMRGMRDEEAARMKEIAAAVPEQARPALVEFLTSLTGEMEKGRLDVGG